MAGLLGSLFFCYDSQDERPIASKDEVAKSEGLWSTAASVF
jgi:hypothetical protein